MIFESLIICLKIDFEGTNYFNEFSSLFSIRRTIIPFQRFVAVPFFVTFYEKDLRGLLYVQLAVLFWAVSQL